jgi:hypothetical protein
MHSSGRGEDSPEAYRGVVLPSGQQQPVYGEQVQPASGSPWGAPEPVPEAPDATQMLPPYPGGDPGAMHPLISPMPPAAPIADATQMLPPYPGDNPGALGPHAGHVPPLPPVPPQAPFQAPYMPPQQGPADATQALPLSLFQDQQGGPVQAGYDQHPYEQQGGGPPQAGYDQQPYDKQPYEQQGGGYDQQGYGGPGGQQPYGGQDGQDPFGQEYAGYEQEQTGPQHDSDYDHLFRQDVPSPAPIRPHIIQPDRQPYGRQQGGYDQGQGQGQGPGPGPGYDQGQGPGQGYEPAYAYDEDGSGGGRKMSPKVLIGIVVAGCVVAGLVVGGMLSGGGGSHPENTADKTSTQPATGTSAGTAATTGADPAEQQASALDSLLGTSDTSRSSVVSAVESIKGCDKLPAAASDLHTAAGQRKSLVTKLAALSVDKLPDHGALTDSLTQAWQASSAADTHYANWATQAESHKVCKGGHARSTGETQAGDRESGTATTQKKKAVKLWNSIAKRYGLTQRQYSQL